MIQAEDFLQQARERGYEFYSGVPSAWLGALVDAAADSDGLTYVAAVNAGEAVALSAGQALGGRRAVAVMSAGGLASAIDPLGSLSWEYRLPVLLIVAADGATEKLDALTTEWLRLLEIPWADFPRRADETGDVLARAEAHMAETGRPFALLMGAAVPSAATGAERGSPSQSRGAITFRPAPPRRAQLARREALGYLVERTDPLRSIIVAATGSAGRELYAVADRANHLYLRAPAGYSAPLALGLALARPDLTVIAVDGDGAALMYLGAMATLAAYGPTNLCYLVLDNGVHEAAGGAATVSAGLSFAAIAAASGWRTTYEGHDCTVVDRMLAGSSQGPALAHLHIARHADAPLPAMPALAPVAVKERLMAHMAAKPAFVGDAQDKD